MSLSRRILTWAAGGVLIGTAAGVALALRDAGGPDGAERSPDPNGYTVQIPQAPSEVGVALKDAGCSPVEHPEDQGAHEILVGAEHPEYSSMPPTSGWFHPGPLDDALYYIHQEPEDVLRNMAEGEVIVWHTGLSEEDVNELKGFFILMKDTKLVGVSGQELRLEDPIILTAWGAIQRCQMLSGEAIAGFLETYRGQGVIEPGLPPGAGVDIPADPGA